MLRSSPRNTTIAAVAAFALYFALATWSKLTWVDPVPKGRVVVRIERPLELHGKFAVASYQFRSQEPFESTADSNDNRTRSPLLLYEGTKLLGPAHSSSEDVGNIGQGRYLHWRNVLMFSASDNSDINTNKRIYWAVLPN
jgi:hypothetical protein